MLSIFACILLGGCVDVWVAVLRAPVLNCLLDARSKMTNVATVASGSP